MDYEAALDYIHGLNRLGWKLGLENIKSLLARLGDPQRKLRAIHVAGTNGKGSTSAFIASALRAAGYSTGLYTSPYLTRFTERIQVDGEHIPGGELARLAGEMKAVIAKMAKDGCQHPTEFEVVTAIAMEYFVERECDAVVLEVGLGGRYDATNVIDSPMAAVVSTIDYDHMAYLGDTLEVIAFEKGGIIKPGCEAVLYPQRPSVQAVFERIARDVGAPLRICDFSSIHLESRSLSGQSFRYKWYESLRIGLLGGFQLRNASLAIEAVEAVNRGADAGAHGIRIPESAIREGLEKTRWPGRLELVRSAPPFVVDVAHNAQCAKALREAFEECFPGMRAAFVFGMLEDKDHASVIDATMPIADAVFTVTPDSPRALSAQALAGMVGARFGGIDIRACSSIAEAVDAASAYAAERGLVVCAFGSFFFTGQTREHILGTNKPTSTKGGKDANPP